jgi:hypothetical protein
LKEFAAYSLASKPARAMPTGSIQTQHMASSAKPNASTSTVASTRRRLALTLPSLSVSSVTAKSMRRRVITDAPTNVSHTTEYTAASSTQYSGMRA